MGRIDSVAGAKQISTFVFLTPRPVSAVDAEKWGFGYLRSQGFEVVVLELSRLLNKDNAVLGSILNAVEQPLESDSIHRIGSYQVLEAFVRDHSSSSIFIDYLVGCSNVSIKEERIFRLLKKYGANYTFLTSGALPLPSLLATDRRKKYEQLQAKLMKALTSPMKLLSYLSSKVILYLTRHRIAYPLPMVIFGGESEVLRHYVDARGIGNEAIVPINSFDYDTSVRYLRSTGNKLPGSENTCVFLDEAATHHSDFALLGIKPAIAEDYYASMNRFFDFVEEVTGCKVIIAAHPRSRYETMPDVFKGRPVIKGKTVELVAKSKLVVMHMSTSLSYAVLFNKPVIPIKIPGMPEKGQLNLMVETMAAAIGSKPIDLNKDELAASLLRRECNHERYFEYINRYVKTVGAEELPAWEIVAKTIKRMRLGTSR